MAAINMYSDHLDSTPQRSRSVTELHDSVGALNNASKAIEGRIEEIAHIDNESEKVRPMPALSELVEVACMAAKGAVDAVENAVDMDRPADESLGSPKACSKPSKTGDSLVLATDESSEAGAALDTVYFALDLLQHLAIEAKQLAMDLVNRAVISGNRTAL